MRKTSEPDMGTASSVVRRSTDCLVSQQKDLASSSDSDLLRSAPPWAQSRFPFTAPDRERSGMWNVKLIIIKVTLKAYYYYHRIIMLSCSCV